MLSNLVEHPLRIQFLTDVLEALGSQWLPTANKLVGPNFDLEFDRGGSNFHMNGRQ